MMQTESPRANTHPTLHLENYTSWYRYISQDQGLTFELISALKSVLEGFDYFRFEAYGEKHRLLKIYFRHDADISIGYTYNELSDGQRMLIALYSLLYAARANPEFDYTLLIDEPGNFLALPEIQPWLSELYTERLTQLARHLTERKLLPRQTDERIGIFIPRRNIETWIHYLQGESVNEIDEYAKFYGNEAM